MRRVPLLFFMFIASVVWAAPKLSHDVAKKRISELASSTIVPDAIEIREITQVPPNQAIVESTITLAFQFKRLKEGAWAVDAIRFGDNDWVNMNELLIAVYHGNPPPASALVPTPAVEPLTPI